MLSFPKVAIANTGNVLSRAALPLTANAISTDKPVEKPADKPKESLVTGETGPSTNYGINAAINFQRLTPEVQATTSIQVTPADKGMFIDFFGYAKQDIKRLDKNNDGMLDKDELTKLFKDSGLTENEAKTMADTFLKALDLNGDSKVDLEENTLFLLYQDWKVKQDGKITPEEVSLALTDLLNDPEKLKKELEKLKKDVLEKRKDPKTPTAYEAAREESSKISVVDPKEEKKK